MRVKRTWALVFGALATAAGLSVVYAAGLSSPPSGSWQCFNADKFPEPSIEPARWPAWDPSEAAADYGSRAFAVGLNRVAKNSPAGTTLSPSFKPTFGNHYNLICVKY
jgi:hypothetical protein